MRLWAVTGISRAVIQECKQSWAAKMELQTLSFCVCACPVVVCFKCGHPLGRFGQFQANFLPQWLPPERPPQGTSGEVWRRYCWVTQWVLPAAGVGRVGCGQASHKGQDGSPGKTSIVLNLRNPVQICPNPTGIHRGKRRSKADESVVTSSLKGEYIKPSTPPPPGECPAAASPLACLVGWFSLAPSPLSPLQNPTPTPPMHVPHGGFP